MRLSGSTSKGLKTAEIAASGKNGFVESLRNDDLDATHTSASPKSAVFLIGSVAIMAPRPRSSDDRRRHRDIGGFTRSLMRPFKILKFRAMNGPILDAAKFDGPPDQRVCCNRKLLAGLGHTNGGVWKLYEDTATRAS